MSIKLEDLYTASGYGTFRFYRNGEIANVTTTKDNCYKSAGSLENLKAKFKSELEAEILRITTEKAGQGWVLIKSFPIIEYAPATEKEKLKTLLIAIRQGDVKVISNDDK